MAFTPDVPRILRLIFDFRLLFERAVESHTLILAVYLFMHIYRRAVIAFASRIIILKYYMNVYIFFTCLVYFVFDVVPYLPYLFRFCLTFGYFHHAGRSLLSRQKTDESIMRITKQSNISDALLHIDDDTRSFFPRSPPHSYII